MSNGSSNGTLALLDCTQSDAAAAERVNYFPRQLLTAEDMFADQDYFRLKLQRHNRFLHGWGTVCGLLVTASPAGSPPWLVQIGAGYALGPYGDEIYVADPVTLDLSTCGASAVTNPCDPGSSGTGTGPSVGSTVYIAIQYSECMSRPVSVTPAGCGCEQTSCQNSRIRDSFAIQCLAALPPSYQLPPSTATMCDYLNHQEVPDCPACPSDPWIVLAVVVLPASSSAQIADSNIDNYSYRRQIFGTAILQEQVAACCCAPSPTPTPTPPPSPAVTTVTAVAYPNPFTGQGTLNLTPGQQFSNAGPSFLKVTFSQPVLRATVTGSTFTVTATDVQTGAALPNVTGSISFDDNSPSPTSLSATFTPAPGSGFFPTSLGDSVRYTVTLVGTGAAPILDVNHLALDGDGNGKPGGDYANNFVVVLLLL